MLIVLTKPSSIKVIAFSQSAFNIFVKLYSFVQFTIVLQVFCQMIIKILFVILSFYQGHILNITCHHRQVKFKALYRNINHLSCEMGCDTFKYPIYRL